MSDPEPLTPEARYDKGYEAASTFTMLNALRDMITNSNAEIDRLTKTVNRQDAALRLLAAATAVATFREDTDDAI